MAVFADNVSFHLEGALSSARVGAQVRCLMRLVQLGEGNPYAFSQMASSGRLNEGIARLVRLLADCTDGDVLCMGYLLLLLVCFDDGGQLKVSFADRLVVPLLRPRRGVEDGPVTAQQAIAAEDKKPFSSFSSKRKLGRRMPSPGPSPLVTPRPTGSTPVSEGVRSFFAVRCPGLYRFVAAAGPEVLPLMLANRVVLAMATTVSSGSSSRQAESESTANGPGGVALDSTKGRFRRLQVELATQGLLAAACYDLSGAAEGSRLWLRLGLLEGSCYGSAHNQVRRPVPTCHASPQGTTLILYSCFYPI